MLLTNLSVLTALGIICALVTEFITVSASWTADIRSEWCCWAGLYVALRLRGYVSSNRHAQGTDFGHTDLSWNWRSWAIAASIAAARLIRVYHNVDWVLPLVTCLAKLSSLWKTGESGVLPISGCKEPDVKAFQSISVSKIWKLSWVRSGVFVVSGICLTAALYCYATETNMPYVASAGYFIFQSFGLITLAAYGSFINDDSNPRFKQEREPASWYAFVESLVFRVLCIITGFMVVFSRPDNLAGMTVVKGVFSAGDTAIMFAMIALGALVSSSTVDTFSAVTVRSLGNIWTGPTLILSIISTCALLQGIFWLPPSERRRYWLLLFMMLPVLSILPQTAGLVSQDGYIQRLRHSSDYRPSIHPIEYLATKANREFETMVSAQSRSLVDAVAEYKTRYHRSPPPGFDRWFQAALSRDFVLTDEFDVMMRPLEPLWGVSPADLRGRVDSVVAAKDDHLVKLSVADHAVLHSTPALSNWMVRKVRGWLTTEVLDTLPDLALAINTYDEPRVVVPHDVLERTLTPKTLDGDEPATVDSKTVNFLNVGQQKTRDFMTLSCPVDSPARDPHRLPDRAWYSVSNLGLLSNVSMSKDVCLNPELRKLHGMFMEPQTLIMTHTLVPIFSQAKPSCFQDLLYPSPFYWAKLDEHEYAEEQDLDWEHKQNTVYWAGSTTGGYSTTENWRSLQRQRLTLLTMDHNRSITLMRRDQDRWQTVDATIAEISSLLNVHISAVIQCAYDACDAERSAFGIDGGGDEHRDSVRASYEARYSLDLDGNSFSGRFYRLLGSKSAVLKQTILQEWHDDWLVPWVHYIPVSIGLDDMPEIVRYLTQEPEGEALGKRIAHNSRTWAGKVLRKQDLELAFWRILLEYGRIMSDDREEMECC